MKIPLRSFVERFLLVALLEGLDTLGDGTWLEAVGQQGNPGLQSLPLLVLCEVKNGLPTCSQGFHVLLKHRITQPQSKPSEAVSLNHFLLMLFS